MNRSGSAPMGFGRRTTICLAAFVCVTLPPTNAQQPATACQLLQVADLESAIGGKASTKPTGERSAVPGMTLDTCSVGIRRPGSSGVHVVGIQVMTNLPMDGAQAILVRNTGTAREPQWKSAGAVLEQKTVGSAVCIRYGRPSVPGHTICSIPRGKGYVEVDVQARVEELVSLETVAALTQKAAAVR